MAAEVFYRKWRPQTLAEVMGQSAVTTTLSNAVRTGHVGHAYLFCGPRGTGKTSTGRILAKAVNCLNPQGGEPCNACEACVSISEGRCLDVIEIDAASNRGVDDIRLLRERVHYAAGMVRRKVYIIDEVHMLTDAASNALLKTLEEPPPHVMFILATTEYHRVLPTIVSRCQSFHFRRLTLDAIAAKLQVVCERESIEAGQDVLVAISRSAGGSLRDAENILQQLMASLGQQLTLGDVRVALGIADESYVMRVIASIGSKDLSGGFRLLHDASDAGVDMRQLGRQVVSTLRDAMLIQSGCEDIVEGGIERLAELRVAVNEVPLERIAFAARRFADMTARDAAQPLLSLELALVDAVLDGSTKKAPQEAASSGSPARKGSEPDAGASARSGHMPSRPHGRQTAGHTEQRVPPASAQPAGPAPEVGQQVVAATAPASEARQPVPAQPEPANLSVEDGPSTAIPTGAASPEVSAEGQTGMEPVASGELGRVQASWKEYVDSLRGLGSTGNLDAFLRSACEPVSLEEDVLVLRFAYEFHKSKIEDPKYRHVVEERLEEFYGRPFKVSCVLEAPSDTVSSEAAPKVKRESMVDAAPSQRESMVERPWSWGLVTRIRSNCRDTARREERTCQSLRNP